MVVLQSRRRGATPVGVRVTDGIVWLGGPLTGDKDKVKHAGCGYAMIEYRISMHRRTGERRCGAFWYLSPFFKESASCLDV
jgi:hypothetical protein